MPKCDYKYNTDYETSSFESSDDDSYTCKKHKPRECKKCEKERSKHCKRCYEKSKKPKKTCKKCDEKESSDVIENLDKKTGNYIIITLK